MNPPPYTIDQHIGLGRVSAVAVSPCGTWLAVEVQRLDQDGAKYVGDLWKVPLDGAAAVQLTRGDSRDSAPCFRHDGALGFLSNRKPNECKVDEDADKRMQVWLLPGTGGEPWQLTDEPLGVEVFRFARGADRLVLLAPVLPEIADDQQRETAAEHSKKGSSARRFRRQPVRHWDHWLHQNPDLANTHVIGYTADGRMRQDLTPDAQDEFAIEPALAVSEDGKHAAITRHSPGPDRELDSALLLIGLDTGQQCLLGAADYAMVEAPAFAPDGLTLAATRSVRSPKHAPQPRIVLFDIAAGAMRELCPAWDSWQQLHGWSRDGTMLICTADDHGCTPIFGVDAVSGRVSRISATQSGGSHSGLTALPDGRIVGIRSTLCQVPEVFVVSTAEQSQPRLLAGLSGFEPFAGVEVEDLRMAATDGAEIQSWLIKPRGAKGPLPTLVWIHGGPLGMSSDGWHWRWNPLLLVAQGYAVVQPNPRGSTGFGQHFVQGVWGNVWGAQCYQDLMTVCDALTLRPDIDGARLMAMGGSFGGYMSNWIGTQTDRFRCIITHASIVGMASFSGVTDHPPWWYAEMGGENPYADPDHFDRFAPWKYLQRWKSPTLIIHGEKDYRCPIGEALMLFEALQYHGVESELLVFPDEGHWILRPPNIRAWYETISAFLARHMA